MQFDKSAPHKLSALGGSVCKALLWYAVAAWLMASAISAAVLELHDAFWQLPDSMWHGTRGSNL